MKDKNIEDNNPTDDLPDVEQIAISWDLVWPLDLSRSMNHSGFLNYQPVIGWATSDCTLEERKLHFQILVNFGMSKEEAAKVAYALDWESPPRKSIVNILSEIPEHLRATHEIDFIFIDPNE